MFKFKLCLIKKWLKKYSFSSELYQFKKIMSPKNCLLHIFFLMLLYCTVVYCTVLYCTVHYITLQYSTITTDREGSDNHNLILMLCESYQWLEREKLSGLDHSFHRKWSGNVLMSGFEWRFQVNSKLSCRDTVFSICPSGRNMKIWTSGCKCCLTRMTNSRMTIWSEKNVFDGLHSRGFLLSDIVWVLNSSVN